LKLKVEIDGEELLLDLRNEGETTEYTLSGVSVSTGQASIVKTMPGVYSVLLGTQSVTVALARRSSELEVWAGGRRHTLSLSDPRDRAGSGSRVSAAGPVEIRAQMPGKVIKLLVDQGSTLEAGQGVIIVEAMKMQNEMKSPKNGTVVKIHAAEGSTVAAGEALMVIE
jgi:biotin carboxyl carrier protein